MYNHLTKDNRISLSTLLQIGYSIRECAKQLGFSPSCISKEVKRNGVRYAYNPYKAHRRYIGKRKEANQCHRKLGKNMQLTNKVLEFLKKDWSPEQIVGRMLLEHGHSLASPTSIYNYINPRRELHCLLPRKCNKYRRTKANNERKKAREMLSTKKLIDIRPKIVDERKEIGHWEGDTIVGKEKTSRMLTNVERVSGYLLADLLPAVSADIVRESSVKLFKQIPFCKKRTITYDNGSEFSDYELIEKQTQINIYFAHPYHSWERGTNENTNGLIRRYFPKSILFSSINLKQFRKVINNINHRPRKRLGFKTPYEVFYNVNFRTLM